MTKVDKQGVDWLVGWWVGGLVGWLVWQFA